VEFEDGLVGLLHKNNMAGKSLDFGDRVEVEVLWVDVVQRRMGLKLLSVLEEEAGDMVPGV
jgi:ribosomal protein S1